MTLNEKEIPFVKIDPLLHWGFLVDKNDLGVFVYYCVIERIPSQFDGAEELHPGWVYDFYTSLFPENFDNLIKSVLTFSNKDDENFVSTEHELFAKLSKFSGLSEDELRKKKDSSLYYEKAEFLFYLYAYNFLPNENVLWHDSVKKTKAMVRDFFYPYASRIDFSANSAEDTGEVYVFESVSRLYNSPFVNSGRLLITSLLPNKRYPVADKIENKWYLNSTNPFLHGFSLSKSNAVSSDLFF